MANNTSISQLTPSDSSITALRKKSNSEPIDVSQLLFFEELLSIGQFESSQLDSKDSLTDNLFSSDPTGLNKSDSDSGQESGQDSTTDKGEETRSPEEAAPSNSAPVLVQQQLAPIQTPKQADSSDLSKNLPEPVQATAESDKPPAMNSQMINEPTAEKDSVETLDPTKGNETKSLPIVDASSNATSKDPAVQSPSQEGEVTLVQEGHDRESDLRAESPLLQTAAPIQKSRESANNSSSDTNQEEALKKSDSDAESKNVNRTPVFRNEFESNAGVATESNSTADAPQNRRSKRLGERAKENNGADDGRESSPVESPRFESSIPKVTTGSQAEDNALSSTSLSNTVLPSPSVSPVIATPIAAASNLSNNSNINNVSVSKINGERASAIASSTTLSSGQTNASGTTISGATSGPGRADQGRSEVARSNAGTPISPYQETKLVQRVMRGLEQLANGGGQVRLRLHPPELGSLQMTLRMEAGQVFAKLDVESTTARDALLSNAQTLRDRLAEQGLKVASFEVEVSTDSSGTGTSGSNWHGDGSGGSDSRWGNATGRYAQQNNNRLSTDPTQPERKSATEWTRTNGSLDLTV